MTTTTIFLAGAISVTLALYSIITMAKSSIWPTIVLGTMGLGLMVGAFTAWSMS